MHKHSTEACLKNVPYISRCGSECIRCVTVSLCKIPPVTISHFHSCGFLYFVQVYDWGGYTFKILHKYTIRIWIVWQYEEHVFYMFVSIFITTEVSVSNYNIPKFTHPWYIQFRYFLRGTGHKKEMLLYPFGIMWYPLRYVVEFFQDHKWREVIYMA